MMLLGRGATKALVEETTHSRTPSTDPRIETVFMVAKQQ
jgi:hypothetical protein